jgi:uroporphyrinogen-III decarboxylase
VPIGTDLVLHKHEDWRSILLEGDRLGAVVAEAADRFHTPLALPLMDLRLEKAEVMRRFQVPDADVDRFHFPKAPSSLEIESFARALRSARPDPAITANLQAVKYVRDHTDLYPIGMCIGPFSLTTKLMADPITAVYLAGAGVGSDEEPDVALLEACLRISTLFVHRMVEWSIEAGARAIFVAEPAANQIYISPLQMQDGSNVFERFVLEPNCRIADLMADRGVDLILHSCGEMSDEMLDGLCSLRPAMMSLGSSRCLWKDAKRVPQDIVLYGNLPSKMFYSDSMMPRTRVTEMIVDLSSHMAATGHAFILGTECDTLNVPEYAATIRSKVELLINVPVKV